ncbi:MAG: hypothetical protein KME32_16215 [Mojavia pulchra JT2-VF2]|jgi:uncharacterized membrane protein YeaQ/YmgE (transglycosylase-associated protein family)|uniref:Uncharacterized protein n=1 Tax=Mojavia pulchra JT2-VF2 TaxID=287848 RepID=A0A951PZQ7_9NOST|nr:hypothetical protein [Mojavia pulchra JT2-VF2]
MAQKNNDLFNLSPQFLSQLIFGLILTLVLSMSGSSLALSIFLGIIGGFSLGWITAASNNSPQAQSVASSDGIDAALKYWLFFLVGFSWLGYPAPSSILLGAVGALAAGLIFAWWGSKEETRTQLPLETAEDGESEQSSSRITRQQRRKPTRRFRRTSRGINFRFWER